MIYINSSKTGKQVGCITSDIDLETALVDARPIIDAELNTSDYQFMVCGTALTKKQERKYKFGKCLSQTGKDFELELDICENEPADDMPVDESPRNADKEEEAEESKESDAKKNMPKMFSKEEIENETKYLERERKMFHNMKIDAIRNDSSFKDWNHTEVIGVIDVDWTLKKTTLLKNSVKEIICSDDEAKENPSERTLMKNLEELEKAEFMVNHHYEQLCQDLKIKGEGKRDELESEFPS
jgi:hypothetical protein